MKKMILFMAIVFFQFGNMAFGQTWNQPSVQRGLHGYEYNPPSGRTYGVQQNLGGGYNLNDRNGGSYSINQNPLGRGYTIDNNRGSSYSINENPLGRGYSINSNRGTSRGGSVYQSPLNDSNRDPLSLR